MKEKLKPVPGGNREQAGAKLTGQTSILQDHFNMEQRRPSSGVSALLGVGRENARTAREIARTMGVSDARVITHDRGRTAWRPRHLRLLRF